jgi:hypothetical protein
MIKRGWELFFESTTRITSFWTFKVEVHTLSWGRAIKTWRISRDLFFYQLYEPAACGPPHTGVRTCVIRPESSINEHSIGKN